jgi:hypothetical protein
VTVKQLIVKESRLHTIFFSGETFARKRFVRSAAIVPSHEVRKNLTNDSSPMLNGKKNNSNTLRQKNAENIRKFRIG